MAWRRIGDKPLSEPIPTDFLTHVCGTRGRWIKKAERITTIYSCYAVSYGSTWVHICMLGHKYVLHSGCFFIVFVWHNGCLFIGFASVYIYIYNTYILISRNVSMPFLYLPYFHASNSFVVFPRVLVFSFTKDIVLILSILAAVWYNTICVFIY